LLGQVKAYPAQNGRSLSDKARRSRKWRHRATDAEDDSCSRGSGMGARDSSRLLDIE